MVVLVSLVALKAPTPLSESTLLLANVHFEQEKVAEGLKLTICRVLAPTLIPPVCGVVGIRVAELLAK